MPITINDCAKHKKTPKLKAVRGFAIYCIDCEKLPNRDTLYVFSIDAIKAVKNWNDLNEDVGGAMKTVEGK